MRLLYLPRALDDLAWIHSYYIQTFSGGAAQAWHVVAAAEALITEQPFIGVALSEIDGVRALRLAKTPFSFIYCLRRDRDIVEIAGVWDGRSDPKGLRFL